MSVTHDADAVSDRRFRILSEGPATPAEHAVTLVVALDEVHPGREVIQTCARTLAALREDPQAFLAGLEMELVDRIKCDPETAPEPQRVWFMGPLSVLRGEMRAPIHQTVRDRFLIPEALANEFDQARAAVGELDPGWLELFDLCYEVVPAPAQPEPATDPIVEATEAVASLGPEPRYEKPW